MTINCRSRTGYSHVLENSISRFLSECFVAWICLVFSRMYLVPSFLFLVVTFSYPADRYWVATDPGDWNNTSNWSNISGGTSGYPVPGDGDIAIFDSGSNANCTISQNVEVEGVVIGAPYTGAISLHSGITLTITNSGFSQTGGTFQANGGDLLINGAFDVTGGLFLTDGILDIGNLSNSSPAPDIWMGFESNEEPYETVPYRAPDPNDSGNGCLDATTWNTWYVRDVCVAPTCELDHFAIERSTLVSRSGQHSLRFYLQPTPPALWPQGEATHRAELSPKYNSPVNHYPVEGEEVWYGLSCFFPDDFVFAPQNIEEDIRFAIAQWQHGSPGSSIVALEVIGNHIVVQRQTGSSENSIWVTPISLTTIQPGQWIDLVFRIKWSQTNGLIHCWVDGQLALSLDNIQTIYNNLSVGGGFKMGIYYWRWKDYQSVQNTLNAGITQREIFLDEIRQYKGVDGYHSVVPGQ
jgi:hypothetical protein